MGLIPRAWLRHVQGNGHFEWVADECLAGCLEHNTPFPDDLARGEPRLLLLRLAGNGLLSLGSPAGTLYFPASGELAGFVDLVWPGEDSDLLRQAGWEDPLPAGQVALVMALQGETGGGGTVRPRRARVEARLAGQPHLLLARRYPRDLGSRDMLKDLFGRLCLPAGLDAAEETVDAETALAVSWDGTLRVAAEAFAGASLMAAAPLPVLLDAPGLASLQAGFRVRGQVRRTGRLRLVVSGAGGPGRVRAKLTVGRAASGRLAVDVNASAALTPAGALPALEEVLGRLLGMDFPRILRVLAGLTEAASAPAVSEPLSALVLGEILDPLLRQAEGAVLPAEAIRRIASAVNSVLSLDETLRDLVLRHAGALPALRERLGDLLSAAGWADVSGQTLRFLAGEGVDVAGLLERQQDLRAWRRQLERALSLEILPTLEQVLAQVVGTVRAREVLARLARFRTPEELRETVHAPVRQAAEAVLGRALDQAPMEELRRLLQLAATAQDAFESLSRAFDAALEGVLGREWQAGASLEALREDEAETVLEAGYDLAEAAGRRAFRALADGDALPSLAAAGGKGVSAASGRFTRRLQRRIQVELQLGPLHWTSLENLISNQRLEIRAEGQGWAHALTLEAKGEKRRAGPAIGYQQSEFTLRASAKALLPSVAAEPDFPAPVLRASYRLNAEDPASQPAELAALLEPALEMGLLPGATPGDLAEELLEEAGQNPAVRFTWHVRVPPAAFRAILEEERAGAKVEEAILEILRWNYLRHGSPGSWLRVLGGALAATENRQLFLRRGRLAGAPCVACLGPAQGKAVVRRVPLGPVDRQRLEAVYRVARIGGEVFERMSAHVQSGAVGLAEIERFAVDVAELHNRLARWGLRLDTLPHVLFRATGGPGGTAAGGAALEVEIRPKRGEPIRRYFKSPS